MFAYLIKSEARKLSLVYYVTLGSICNAYSGSHNFDALNRLIRIDYDDGTSIAYTYDAAGNRLTLAAQAGVAPDRVAPVIHITQPTPERLYVTTASSVTLGGIASDASGIASLSCASDTGAQEPVVGTASWTAGPIALSNGVNRLTISATDPTGNEGHATLVVVALPPETSEQIVFEDDFNDNSIDVTKWTNWGNTVTESGQIMQVLTTVTDNGGQLSSMEFPITSNGIITITRKAFLHHHESGTYMGRTNFFWGKLFIRVGNLPLIGIHYDSLDYGIFSDARDLHGFYISRNGVTQPYLLSVEADVSPVIAPVWDTWFHEKITYDPVSGLLDYHINHTNRMSYSVGALPAGGSPTIQLSMDAWGWWTGHQHLMDDLLVTQTRETAGPVGTRDTDGDGMPDWAEMIAGTSETNASSRLELRGITPAQSGLDDFVLEWSSVAGIYYSVHRATNLLSSPNIFIPIKTGILGLPVSTTYTDTNRPPSGPVFYKIGVDY